MTLTTIDGKKLSPDKPKEPTERMYQFVMRPMGPNQPEKIFESFGVLVVTPGFVGVGDKEQTEIRTVVPLDNVWYVKELGSTMGATQGSA